MPTCWIIAGPNGTGKTTFALDFLPTVNCQHFINADAIAAGLNPIHPEGETFNASRVYLNEIQSADIERRFSKSLRNLLNDFSPIVDRARCLLNQDEHFKLIFTETFEGRIITDEAYYSSLKQQIEQ